MNASPEVLAPHWDAPAMVKAAFTTRLGGVSDGAWAGLNLATHVGDAARAVATNRALLRHALALPADPCWLEQVHGTHVARPAAPGLHGRADASYTRRPGLVCAVLVADCVPVLLCARSGREIAAVHAGWRGLAAGILARAVANFAASAGELLAWIGPAIGPAAYVVGPELRARFVSDDPDAAGAFTLGADGWHLDLKALAALRLQQAGVREVRIDDTCVHTEASRFYSHRRTGTCGRMAALIWLAPG